MTEPSLFVATPTYNGSLSTLCYAGALSAVRRYGDRIEFLALRGLLPHVRNELTKRFLDSGRSHMLCVDADIGWHADHAERLLSAEKDVISGCYLVKEAEARVPAKYLFAEGQTSPEEIQECSLVPAGFLLVRRHVITALWERGLVWRFGQGEAENGRGIIGEDYMFCRRWRELGGKVYLHHSVKVKHVGEWVFEP